MAVEVAEAEGTAAAASADVVASGAVAAATGTDGEVGSGPCTDQSAHPHEMPDANSNRAAIRRILERIMPPGAKNRGDLGALSEKDR